MRATFRVLALGLMACLPACSDKPAAGPQRPQAKIEASVKGRQQVQELIKSHRGKVVVLDLWALW